MTLYLRLFFHNLRFYAFTRNFSKYLILKWSFFSGFDSWSIAGSWLHQPAKSQHPEGTLPGLVFLVRWNFVGRFLIDVYSRHCYGNSTRCISLVSKIDLYGKIPNCFKFQTQHCNLQGYLIRFSFLRLNFTGRFLIV